MPAVKHRRAKEHILVLISDTTLIRTASSVLGENGSVGRQERRGSGLERDTEISKFYSVFRIGLGKSYVCVCTYMHAHV